MCKATLQEYLAQTTAIQVSMVEGCGTRTVGWDARLGGKLYTYDASGALVGFNFWDDVPNGPCKANQKFSYSMGTRRQSLLQVSTACASDQLCTVSVGATSDLHCPTSA
jgi:hypothetical protein